MSGPSGAEIARSVFEAAIARPSSWSGMSLYEYAVIAESVFGNQNACADAAAGRTYTFGNARKAVKTVADQNSESSRLHRLAVLDHVRTSRRLAASPPRAP
jgi:hypothetical protein